MTHAMRRQYANGTWSTDAYSGRYPMFFSKHSGNWEIRGFMNDEELKPVSCQAVPK